MTRADRSSQPSNQPSYRRMYIEIRKLYDRIQSQDSCITYLLVELRAAQKRIAKLEQHNADTAAARLRLAYQNGGEMDELEQRGDLPLQEAGAPPARHPPAVTGL